MLVVVWGRGSAQTVRTAFPSGNERIEPMDFSPLCDQRERTDQARGDRGSHARGVRAVRRETPVTFDTVSALARRIRRAHGRPRWSTIRASSSSRTGALVGFAYAHALPAGRPIGGMRSSRRTSNKERPGRPGRTLYDALLNRLRAQGVKSAYGLVTVPNEASERLHAGCGFQRCLRNRTPAGKRARGTT